jgi:hypothetical protein
LKIILKIFLQIYVVEGIYFSPNISFFVKNKGVKKGYKTSFFFFQCELEREREFVENEKEKEPNWSDFD